VQRRLSKKETEQLEALKAEGDTEAHDELLQKFTKAVQDTLLKERSYRSKAGKDSSRR